jgi:hypothetical protein
VLLLDAPAIAARLAGSASSHTRTSSHMRALDRREANLACSVLDQGRLLVLAPNKLDLLDVRERQAVMRAVHAQVCLS